MSKKSSIVLALLSSTAILSAGDTSSYLSAIVGSFDYDKKVYGDIDGYEIRYQKISNSSTTGIGYTWLKEVTDNNFLLGVSPQLLFADGSFFDGGVSSVSFLAGKSFGKFKLYGNFGYGINSLSEYTVSIGANYGLTARYDIAQHFSMAFSYNIYDMEIGTEENHNPTGSYTIKGLNGSVSYKF